MSRENSDGDFEEGKKFFLENNLMEKFVA